MTLRIDLPSYGDTVLIDLGAGQFVGNVMHVDDASVEISPDGGDTSQVFWLDDLANIEILDKA